MAGILAVDDDLSILKLIKNALETEGHQVTVCSDSAHVLTMDLNRYQLILLDVMMPGIDGFELCSEIRHRVDCPILFLTAKTREADIVRGLGYGADDYLTKPFGIAELRARVDAHLRRDQREKRHSVVVGGMRLSLRSKECFVGPLKAPLTRSEYDIVEFLALSHGQVFSKGQIYEAVFGYEGESDISVIPEHIKNIRKKLSELDMSPIKTVWGVGYKWEV
jgi:DNA-binding response OmpR family regulator